PAVRAQGQLSRDRVHAARARNQARGGGARLSGRPRGANPHVNGAHGTRWSRHDLRLDAGRCHEGPDGRARRRGAMSRRGWVVMILTAAVLGRAALGSAQTPVPTPGAGEKMEEEVNKIYDKSKTFGTVEKSSKF